MADTDWNLHSKQLITPTDNDRMLVEPSDETAKAVEVGGFRNWLMSTALFNTLTTTAKNIIGAIEEVKGIADLNTTQLNDLTQKLSLIKLNSGDDLNSVLNIENEYYMDNDSLVTNVLNVPSGVTTGFNIKFIKTNSNALYGKQILISRNSGTYERAYENGVFGSWVKLPTKSDIDVINNSMASVLLANGTFKEGNTITLSETINNYKKILIVSGDGSGTPNPAKTYLITSINYPSNFITTTEFIIGLDGTNKITVAIGGTSINVTTFNSGSSYIRKIYGLKY